jgi:hypothetical protein
MVLSDGIVAAVDRGDLNAVERALDGGESIDDQYDGATLLEMAVCCYNIAGENMNRWPVYLNIVRRLLERGADPNKVDEDGWSALHFTAELLSVDHLPSENQKVIVATAELLLAHGAHINAATTHLETPLHFLCGNGCTNMDMFCLLLKHGADPDLRDDHDFDAQAIAQLDPRSPTFIVDLLADVSSAGSWKKFVREPSVKLLTLRHLALAGRATAPPSLVRLFGTPPVKSLEGAVRTRSRRLKSSAARTPLPEEVFELVLAFWSKHPA